MIQYIATLSVVHHVALVFWSLILGVQFRHTVFMLVSVLKKYLLGKWLVSDLSIMHIVSFDVGKFHDLPARTLDDISGLQR